MTLKPTLAVFAGALALAACTAPGSVVPQHVKLTPDAVRVSMSDGTLCTGMRASAIEAGPAGWSGRLQGCREDLPYSVHVQRANLAAGLMTEVFDVLGAKDLLSRAGRVQVTDGAGRVHTFVTPPPVPKGQSHGTKR
ncbi:hypothetical protein FGG78_24870 [Thioclava sp. BHET1]|nr:hypothetical protein FGG78_24870 [Thioclava sp. BHET1]